MPHSSRDTDHRRPTHPRALRGQGHAGQGGPRDHRRRAAPHPRHLRQLSGACPALRARRLYVSLDFSMSLIADSLVTAPLSQTELNLDQAVDRRTDILAKQSRVGKLLQEAGCEALLLFEPENIAWFSSGATSRGVLDAREQPALFVTPEQRWLVCSNVDTQRLFDEELDGLGFQLKEWPWHWGRAQLLSDLCQGRRVASDRPLNGCQAVGDRLRTMRRRLTAYEQACYRALGQI